MTLQATGHFYDKPAKWTVNTSPLLRTEDWRTSPTPGHSEQAFQRHFLREQEF